MVGFALLNPPYDSYSARLLLCGENAIRLRAPVGAARKSLRAFGAEYAVVGEVGNECLPLGGAFRRPRREPRIADGFRDLADLFGAAPSVLDHALEEIRS